MEYEPISAEDEDFARQTIGAAIEVHRCLGAGFLEIVYEKAMIHELRLRNVSVEKQKEILVPFEDLQIDGQRLDLLVAGRIIVELKAVSEFHPLHQAQLLSYLKATNLRLGLLINFNVPVLKDGVKRIVNYANSVGDRQRQQEDKPKFGGSRNESPRKSLLKLLRKPF